MATHTWASWLGRSENGATVFRRVESFSEQFRASSWGISLQKPWENSASKHNTRQSFTEMGPPFWHRSPFIASDVLFHTRFGTSVIRHTALTSHIGYSQLVERSGSILQTNTTLDVSSLYTLSPMPCDICYVADYQYIQSISTCSIKWRRAIHRNSASIGPPIFFSIRVAAAVWIYPIAGGLKILLASGYIY